MKTVKDVYDKYKEWPETHNGEWWIGIGVCSQGNIRPYQNNSTISNENNGCYKICTREQYEQYKAEQENKNMKASWYDYDKGEAVSLPPVNTECLVFNHDLGKSAEWEKCTILFIGDFKCVYTSESCKERVGDIDTIGKLEFRPLDHDKYKVKAAPMDWLVGSGIDCEFSNDGVNWHVSLLDDTRGLEYCDFVKLNWKQCRPRMNHKHVLTQEQYSLIPHEFKDNTYITKYGDCIVEFTGLKDGYKFAHDVEW